MKILRKPHVCEKLDIRTKTLNELMKTPDFPKPFRINGGTSRNAHLGFVEEELDAWINMRRAAVDADTR